MSSLSPAPRPVLGALALAAALLLTACAGEEPEQTGTARRICRPTVVAVQTGQHFGPGMIHVRSKRRERS